ncbi:putative signal peptide-containing secreted protein [Cryptosporidium canis]|uniref:Signal peptide-containing secreted protein n=1 Tax=Cryptosporidium canis TaxID=195482 RepID=A0A9D5DLX8_9CRYT|nr:putative signal peptide-containing secreted protein [Cryptosporidium canis]
MYSLLFQLFVLLLSLLIRSNAHIKLWNFKKTENGDKHEVLHDYFLEMSTFTGNTEFIYLSRKLSNTIASQSKMLSSGEKVQLICENSLLRLLKGNLVDSNAFSNYMSVLRDSISLWDKSFKLLQESDEVRTFREFVYFLDFIDTRKFEIDFCIRLLSNLHHPMNEGDRDSLRRKENLCVGLKEEIEDFISKKLSFHSSGVLEQLNKNISEMFKAATGSIHNELDKSINRVNRYNRVFNLILFLNNLRRSLDKSKEFEPYLTLKDIVDGDSLKANDESEFSQVLIELHEYLPENTMFVLSPLSKIVLFELRTASEQLKMLNGCSKYEHIAVPLKKKLIYMIKSITGVLVSYEKSFKVLRGILKHVSYINLVFDKNMADLCTYDFDNNNEPYNITLLDEILTDNFDHKASGRMKPHPTEIRKHYQYSKSKLESGALLENRNMRGLPFFPDSKENDIFREKMSEKPSVNDIQKLIQHINLLADELNHAYIYINNSTNIMLSSLEKLKFTNKVYFEIIQSSTESNAVPSSLYSYSYLLSLDITMSLKKNVCQIKMQALDNKKNATTTLNSVQIKPSLRSEYGESSEEAINKILNIIVSLRQTVHERTQGSGLKNIKARLPTTKKRLYKEVLFPLKCIEDHLLNLKRSNEDAINKMLQIEKQIKQIQINNKAPIPTDNISKLEKYIRPLNFIMKCSVVKEGSEHYEDCRQVLSQAPQILKYVHSLIQENNKTVLNQKELCKRSYAKLESFVKEWNRHLNWIRDVPRICNDQLPTMNKLDSNMRMILG